MVSAVYSIIVFITSATLLVLGLVVFLHSFPPISARFSNVFHIAFSQSDLPILVVSDLHLGSRSSLGAKLLVSVLRHSSARAIVVAGDLFDKKTLLNNKALSLLRRLTAGSVRVVIYVPSTSSHDLVDIPREAVVREIDGKKVFVFPKAVAISVEKCLGKLYVTHGDIAIRNGVAAHITDVLTSKIFSKTFTGAVLRKKLGLGDLDWLIHGHTHIAQINRQYKVASTGCWIDRPHEKIERAFAVVSCSEGVLDVKLIRIP